MFEGEDLHLIDPLSPAPSPDDTHLIGYARVSTGGQKLERQLDALNAAGCRRIFADKQSGKNALRPELKACHEFLDTGDTLVVPSLDRYGRSLQDLITMVAALRARGIGFTSLHEHLDTTTPGGRLIFHVFAALAEFVRELIVEGTNEGLAAARERGTRLGRPPAMTSEQVRQAGALVGKESVAAIARLLGVSRSTLYAHVPELQPRRTAAVAANPAPTPAAIPARTPEMPERTATPAPVRHLAAVHDDQDGLADAEPEPDVRRHAEPELGDGWTTTYVGADDPDRTLWWHDERIGHVRRGGFGTSGWIAERAHGGRVTTLDAPRGTYASRIKALKALAAEAEHQRRSTTEAGRVDLADDVAPGWYMAQTQTDRDAGVWRVYAPDGTEAGHITREPTNGRLSWWEAWGRGGTGMHATADDPYRAGPAVERWWRNRTAAAHAVARLYDPDLA